VAETKLEKKHKAELKDIYAYLVELGGGRSKVVDDLFYDGDKLRIPRSYTWADVQQLAERKIVEESQTAGYSRQFLYRPWDGAFCLANSLTKVFGTFHLKGKMGWFGPTPPSMITVASGVNETTQIPWGDFSCPAIPKVSFECDTYEDEERGQLFKVTAFGPKKHEDAINGVFELARLEMESHSLYRGKAFDGRETPEFVDVYAIDRSKVVYADSVEKAINSNIWSPLRDQAVHSRAGLSFKRAVLVYGTFGVGKTLTGNATGQIAIENGVTFIWCRPGRDNLAYCLQTARLYDPCVLFYEDVDAVLADDNSRSAVSRLLDDFDGIKAKGAKVMIVMTTNYPEQIEQGLLRPGRIDRAIKVADLDQDGVRRLIQTIIPAEQFSADVDWLAVYQAAEGYKPAFYHEFAEAVLRTRIAEHGEEYDSFLITTDEVVQAAVELREQYDLMVGAKTAEGPNSLDQALRLNVEQTLRSNLRAGALNPVNHS